MPLVGKKVQITTDNFGKSVREGCLLVDKSLMIRDFIEGQSVSLIARPRRFGKTLNLSMLHHFFAADVDGQPTKDLFNEFAIANEVDEEGVRYIDQYQGQYPVMFITFKDVKEKNYDHAIEKIKFLIQTLYSQHRDCLQSDELSEIDKARFHKYLGLPGSPAPHEVELKDALSFLSRLLYMVHKKRAVLLIDEYDSPLMSAYEHEYLDELSSFMQTMFSAALKGNSYLEKGLMSGVLSFCQNSMLSGLNNVQIYTLISKSYEQYFGFTDSEVSELMAYLGMSEPLENIRDFYSGYRVGNTVVYNPWSLMNYCTFQQLEPYWVLTSKDKLLKKLLLNSHDDIKENLSRLIQGGSIEAPVSINLAYDELMEKRDTLWTLLLFCGYVTVKDCHFQAYRSIYELTVPNREVMIQYETLFMKWLQEKIGFEPYHVFLNDLVEGRIDVFIQNLTHYLLSCCTSTQDVNNESNYHTFVLGLVSGITATHHVSSNKEFGMDLPDLVLIPKDTERKQAFILGFKQVNYKKQAKANRLQWKFLREDGHDAVIETLHQINSRAYYDSFFLPYPHITDVVNIGIAFGGRLVSAGRITRPIETISQTGSVLTNHDITFYDAQHDEDNTKKKT